MDRAFRWGCLAAVLIVVGLGVASVILGRRNKVFTPPDTLIRYMGTDPEILNPITASDAYESVVNEFIMDSLLTRDFADPNVLLPRLATDWVLSDDHLTYTFHLRQEVKWHDGEPFTSADIIYSYDRIMDPEVDSAHLRAYYQDIEKVEAPDDYTVKFTMIKPYFLALDSLGTIPIVAKHIFDDGTDFNTHPNNEHPIGTGEYRFVKWEKGKQIVLERNEDFWGEKSNFKTIIFRVVTHAPSAFALFKKGELDTIGLSPFQWTRQTDSEKFTSMANKKTYDRPAYYYLGWNMRLPFFQDKLVRRAMTQMIDREKIVKEIYYGLGQVVTGNFFYQTPAYDSTIQPWPYDPEEAKRLLAQTDWIDHDGDGIRDKDGVKFQFTFLISSGSTNAEKVARIVKETLERIGILVNIRQVEWATFLTFLDEWEFGACMLAWSLPWEGDPYQLWHSSLADVHGSSNYVGFKNAEADEIIDTGRVTFDNDKRNAMYRRFHAILHEEQPYTFLMTPKGLMAFSNRLGNVHMYAVRPNYDIREWTYDGMKARMEAPR